MVTIYYILAYVYGTESDSKRTEIIFQFFFMYLYVVLNLNVYF